MQQLFSEGPPRKMTPFGRRMLFFGILGCIVFLILFFNSFAIVESGHVGVVTTAGKVTGEMQPGMHLKWAIVQHVTKMNVQVQKDQTTESAATNDLQDVTSTVALNYHLDHSQVDNVYVNLSPQYESTIIAPAVSEAVKNVTAKYTASQLLTKRPEVTDDITKLLIGRLQPKGIVVDQFSVVNFAFSPQFTQAIESKQAAQQDAEKAQFTLQQAQLTAQANQTQQAALTPQILEQQAIEAWKSGAKLPTTVVGQNSIFGIPLGQ